MRVPGLPLAGASGDVSAIELAAEAALARGNVLRAMHLRLLADECVAGGPAAGAARAALAAAGVRTPEEGDE